MGQLDKYRPVHAPPTDSGIDETAGASPEQLLKGYGLHLQEYVKKRRQFREFNKRNQYKASDPDVYNEMIVRDRELHRIHEELKHFGEKIDKGEYDVIVDILRQEGNLSEEFGLPEFCVLTTEDIFLEYAGGPGFVPKDGKMPYRKMSDKVSIGSKPDLNFFNEKEVMIVFNTLLYEGKGNYYDEYVTEAPDRWAREKRMVQLADAVGGRTMGFVDSREFHAHRMSLQGVIIKKNDLGKGRCFNA